MDANKEAVMPVAQGELLKDQLEALLVDVDYLQHWAAKSFPHPEDAPCDLCDAYDNVRNFISDALDLEAQK